MDPGFETVASVEFGRFRVLPHRRELLAGGRPIKLGGRAFDVLMALIEAHGALVSKDVLMRRVWPNSIVEENSLQAQISALRTAFGADRDLIRTVAGRGYQFTGEIRTSATASYGRAAADSTSMNLEPNRPATNLPASVSELIGRGSEVEEVLSLAMAHRLVTLTGPGGIGKTRLAIEAARQLLAQFADGVWLIELSPLSDPALVPAAIAAVAGLEFAAGEVSAERVARALVGKQLLLVLDTCEHVIDAAAGVAEALLHANPVARVIATSREQLRVEGEWTYIVPPLAVPSENAKDADDVWRYGAAWLFVTRARATQPHFSTEPSVAAAVAVICRRLDGIPLAIELAAASAAALGVEEVAAHLDDRFHLLTGGRRTALPRHQTLRAMLDWSYELLVEPERAILRRVAIFPACFTLEAVSIVAASAEVTAPKALNGLANLVARSLVSADVGGTGARYRLLDTTRAYALEKLTEQGELEAVSRRHAEFCRDLFERAEADWETRPTADWLADYSCHIDDIRTALDWAFSPGGDPVIGIALTASSMPLWTHLSLLDEARGRAALAISALDARSNQDPRREMQLHAALAASLIWTRGAAPDVLRAWARALEVAESLADTEYRLRALYGLWSYHHTLGEYRAALGFAQRFHVLAATSADPTDQLIGDRLIANAQHLLGDQSSARSHIERMLAEYVPSVSRSHVIRFQRDQLAGARSILARIQWVQGLPDRAVRTAEGAIEDVRASHHAASLSLTLAESACPIALLVGDLTAAQRYVSMLLDHSTRHALIYWLAWGHSFEGALAVRLGDAITGTRLLRTGIAELGGALLTVPFVSFEAYLAEALGRAGRVADGLAAIDGALERAERTEAGLGTAELLRIKGEILLMQHGYEAVAAAEHHFRRALECASRQGALSWELRAATSLARLQLDQGRSTEAIEFLSEVYDRFTEGFDTDDLKAAKALIDAR